jgi:hypothetical protein
MLLFCPMLLKKALAKVLLNKAFTPSRDPLRILWRKLPHL